MKRNAFKRFITCGLVVACFSPVNAQESANGELPMKRHEVGYSIGFIPCPYFWENDKGLEDFFYRHYGLKPPAGEERWYHGANVFGVVHWTVQAENKVLCRRKRLL